ncbi:MAG: 3-hydroxyacyl-CoA dehydrogenase family protein [Candidatus Aminicenantes bacterium]|nr:3-hydroxyacyl-CoA dehydrogenase family protein [Candidatus Aminicenantes bacterium]
MNLDELLSQVSIIGAAGKMGSGISTLIAQQVALLKINNPDRIYRINLIDVNEKGMDGLQRYIKTQLRKVAEKSIVSLRHAYESREDLVENWEIINAFIDEAIEALRFDTDMNLARNSKLVFEAVIENEDLKVKILKNLKEICSESTFFFTNTSSIPIGFLDREAGLQGRIIGYHFYNPPIVQKLVEIIAADNTRPELKTMADELGKRLRKKLIPSNDIAGFIGNGHFSRDGLFGISEVMKIKEKYTFPGAIYIMNRITQEFLVRPMGIFQLIDYVGIDVFQSILKVMTKHLQEDHLHSELIDRFMEKNVKGGQRADGSQKDGFFQYKNNRPAGVYDIEKEEYVPIENFNESLDSAIGDLPEGYLPWRKLVAEPDKEAMLLSYFKNLAKADNPGAELAIIYLKRTKEIGEELIHQGVANNKKDVNEVLMNGFYWLYGPVNDYV